jgi:hypothetical protein
VVVEQGALEQARERGKVGGRVRQGGSSHGEASLQACAR